MIDSWLGAHFFARSKTAALRFVGGLSADSVLTSLFLDCTVAQIFKCERDACPRPQCYKSYPSNKENNPPCEVPGCGARMKLVR